MEKTRKLGTEQVVVGRTEGGRSPTGVPPTTTAAAALGTPAAGNGKPIPDPAVSEKPVRRRFTAEYKLRISPEKLEKQGEILTEWVADLREAMAKG